MHKLFVLAVALARMDIILPLRAIRMLEWN